MAIPKPEIYNRIFGWFNFSQMYDTIFASLPKTFTFVEIGVFMGKSISYMAELKMLNNRFHHETQNKDGFIIGIDHFQGSDEEIHREMLKNMSLADKYYQNIAENGLSEHIITLPYDSLTAVNLFADNSIDALFVDGSHDEDAVFKDNNTWLPKVKIGGIIAGHDWSNNFPGVKAAVIRTFGKGNFNIMPQAECWWKVVTEDDHKRAYEVVRPSEVIPRVPLAGENPTVENTYIDANVARFNQHWEDKFFPKNLSMPLPNPEADFMESKTATQTPSSADHVDETETVNTDYFKNSWEIEPQTPNPKPQTPSIWTDVDGLIRGKDEDLKQYLAVHDKHYRMTLEHIYSLMKPAEILPYDKDECCLIGKEKYILLLNKNKEGEKNV